MAMKPTYSYVVARTRNKVIGCENKMPWHLPSDLRNFKKITLGKPVIMGRKTFESIGRALPGRPNIVVSRENGISAQDVFVAGTKSAAMEFAERECRRLGVDEIMIIGGQAVFDLFKNEVSRVYLTEIDATIEGDAFFDASFDGWTEVASFEVPKGLFGDEYSFSFTKLDRNPALQKKALVDIGSQSLIYA
ncbi:MAG: dihydrofolate reductase [Hyphomicrobiaceae bacterium]